MRHLDSLPLTSSTDPIQVRLGLWEIPSVKVTERILIYTLIHYTLKKILIHDVKSDLSVSLHFRHFSFYLRYSYLKSPDKISLNVLMVSPIDISYFKSSPSEYIQLGFVPTVRDNFYLFELFLYNREEE